MLSFMALGLRRDDAVEANTRVEPGVSDPDPAVAAMLRRNPPFQLQRQQHEDSAAAVNRLFDQVIHTGWVVPMACHKRL